MNKSSREIAAIKITAMPPDQVLKVLIFMAGMEAQQTLEDPGCQEDAPWGGDD